MKRETIISDVLSDKSLSTGIRTKRRFDVREASKVITKGNYEQRDVRISQRERKNGTRVAFPPSSKLLRSVDKALDMPEVTSRRHFKRRHELRDRKRQTRRKESQSLPLTKLSFRKKPANRKPVISRHQRKERRHSDVISFGETTLESHTADFISLNSSLTLSDASTMFSENNSLYSQDNYSADGSTMELAVDVLHDLLCFVRTIPQEDTPQVLPYKLLEERGTPTSYSKFDPRLCVADAIIASTWDPDVPLVLMKEKEPYHLEKNTTHSERKREKPYTPGPVLVSWQSRSHTPYDSPQLMAIDESVEAIDVKLSSYAIAGGKM